MVYASARCKMKSRLQHTVLSQHLKQAHVFLYYTALRVHSADVAQIGITALVRNLYCHHFLLLQLTSSWYCHCPMYFHKAIHTGQWLMKGVQQSLWDMNPPQMLLCWHCAGSSTMVGIRVLCGILPFVILHFSQLYIRSASDLRHLPSAYHKTSFTYSLCLAYLWIFGWQMLINIYNVRYDKANFERSL